MDAGTTRDLLPGHCTDCQQWLRHQTVSTCGHKMSTRLSFNLQQASSSKTDSVKERAKLVAHNQIEKSAENEFVQCRWTCVAQVTVLNLLESEKSRTDQVAVSRLA